MDVLDERRATEETARATEARAAEEEPELAAHPGPKQYVLIAVYLAVATALEVGVYYTNVAHPLLVVTLLVLSAIKFSLVVLWFMHLRFDSAIFRRLFVTGLILAMTVYLIVLSIFGALKAPWLIAPALVLLVILSARLFRTARVRLQPEFIRQERGPEG